MRCPPSQDKTLTDRFWPIAADHSRQVTPFFSRHLKRLVSAFYFGHLGVPPSGSRATPRASCRVAAIRLWSLMPPALTGLRAPLADPCMGGVGRSCCSLHRITAFSPSRAARACTLASWRPSWTPDSCAAPCWRRFRAIPPEQPEYDHGATVLFLVRFYAAGA